MVDGGRLRLGKARTGLARKVLVMPTARGEGSKVRYFLLVAQERLSKPALAQADTETGAVLNE